MQDPREPDEEASGPGAGEPEGPYATQETTETPGSSRRRRPFAERMAARWRLSRWNWRTWPDPRDLTWHDLVPRRYRSARFEPGPLGLLGVMLAAMAVTLLLVQTGSGEPGGRTEELTDGPVTVPGPPEGELRVMLVGDSLTQGSSGDYTWRYRLWSHLRESDVEFDFVGPYDDMRALGEPGSASRAYADPGFDADHAARWGASARELASDVAQVAAEHEPHYLLLLAGTEDILAGGGADRALEGVGETVSTVRVVRGQARFVLGELPPVEGTGDDDRINAEIDRFNMGVVDLADQLTSAESPVVVARVADGYVPSRDNWDEAHPNARGEVRIAAAFADALAEPLRVGRTYRRPLPEPEVGPLTRAEPVAEESDEGLLLSWDAVPGATDYRVVQRRVSPDPDQPGVLPVEVDTGGERPSALVESLFSGARYEFVVRSLKGRDEGAESEPLQVVWDDDPPPGPSWVRVLDGGAAVEWEAVEEASHYEVWVRPLDCSVTEERRWDVGTADGSGPPEQPDHGDRPDQGHGREPDRGDPEPPAPDPGEEPGPEPEPTTSAAPEPDAPEPAPGPSPRCERRDGRGPGDGRGWHSLGSAGRDPRWSATVSGNYEVVVRSYRDYVEGGYSDSVLLSEG